MFTATLDFALGEDVDALRDLVRSWAQARVAPIAAEIDRTNAFPNALWREITRTARAGARVIFRTAAEKSILTGRLAPEIDTRWTYLAERSAHLNRMDRSAIYGGFHIYERKA